MHFFHLSVGNSIDEDSENCGSVVPMGAVGNKTFEKGLKEKEY
jgi:hypothetical protein